MNALKGKVIAITRSETDASEFLHLVTAEGGRAIPLKAIEIVPQGSDAVRQLADQLRLKRHDYCAFLSAQTVRILFGTPDSREVRELVSQMAVIAVGPKTKAALQEAGVKVDLVPNEYSSSGIVKMLAGMNPSGKKIIIPRSAAANDDAGEALRSFGMIVDEVVLYHVKTLEVSQEWKDFGELLLDGRVDAVVFTSASNVNAFFEILARVAPQASEFHRLTRILSIGPLTTSELKKRDIQSYEAQVHTIRGVFELATKVLV